MSVNGGRWKAWRTGTKATSDVFLGRQATGYAFRVRAKDSKGYLGAWNVASTWVATPRLGGGFGRVTRDGLSYRTGPSTGAARLGSLKAGTIVALTRGPIYADGFTWYEATQPIREWSTVSFVERGVWIAVAKGSTRFVVAATAPNATIVKAGIRRLDFGAPGTAVRDRDRRRRRGPRAFSPNRDGSEDGLRLRWTNGVAMGSMKLNVLRKDGSLVGSRRRAGARRRRPGLDVGRQDRRHPGEGRDVPAPARRDRRGPHVPGAVGAARHDGAARRLRRPHRHGAAEDHLRVRHEPGHLARTATASTTRRRSSSRPSGGAVRWTARVTNASGAAVRTKTGSARRRRSPGTGPTTPAGASPTAAISSP